MTDQERKELFKFLDSITALAQKAKAEVVKGNYNEAGSLIEDVSSDLAKAGECIEPHLTED